MDERTEIIMVAAELACNAAAMSEAAIAGDFDEARFRAQLIASVANSAGLRGVSMAAMVAIRQLGEYGMPPNNGYGAAILLLADRLEAIQFDL
jgi:hypothetical protein